MTATTDSLGRFFNIQAKFNLYDLRHLAFGGRRDGLMLLLFIFGCVAANPFVFENGYYRFAAFIICAVPCALLLFYNKVKYFFDKDFMFTPIMDQDKDRPFRIESSAPVGKLEDNKGNGICVGYTTDTGDAVFIPYDLISQHISVNGSTGTGKSVLATSMMAQQMRNGGGLCFIDGKLSNKELMAVWQLAYAVSWNMTSSISGR